MYPDRTAGALAALDTHVSNDLSPLLDRHADSDPTPSVLALFQRTVADVPAYREFLSARGVSPEGVLTLGDLRRLPLITKEDYVRRYALPDRCRRGDLSECDTLAVSSGSTGEPTFWPRFLTDELIVSRRFEQIFHDAFEADRRRTLAVVCFPLGTWVGGMFTATCCRHLSLRGYPITTVTPGNNKIEITRVVRALAPHFEQTVLLGYPPFLKDVVDSGVREGIKWHDHSVKLVLAGEVFSEEWRDLMAARAGFSNLMCDTASMYGTADAGVLGTETPLSIVIRRFLSTRPDAARALFVRDRLPTLIQYDPWDRFFEEHEGTLVFSGDNGVPLVRYHIGDEGGVFAYDAMLARLRDFGFDAEGAARAAGARAVRRLPFVYVFGRSNFAVSFYGANVFPETVGIALEEPAASAWVTGKFVLEVQDDAQGDQELRIAVELAPDVAPSTALANLLGDSILAVLAERSSEFANYVPAERKRPRVTLLPLGDPEYFPVGVKHRYSRK
jgi:phenylacetate-CoA ligase